MQILTKLRNWLIFLLGGKPQAAGAKEKTNHAQDVDFRESPSLVVDDGLFERSRTQWHFGDWATLASLQRETIQNHPQRAKLALLAAAGRLQTGEDAEAREYIALAKEWPMSGIVPRNSGRKFLAADSLKISPTGFAEPVCLK